MKSTGYIINGVYHAKVLPAVQLADTESITYKAYNHDKQRREHQRDLIQPYKNGKPNPEFLEQYPEEAKQYGFH